MPTIPLPLFPDRLRQSFGVCDATQMLRKLKFEISEYQPGKADTNNGYRALNVVMTAWHMLDWLAADADNMPELWDALSTYSGVAIQSKEQLRQFVFKQCPAMRFCQTVANAGKHSVATGFSADPTLKTGIVNVHTHHAGLAPMQSREHYVRNEDDVMTVDQLFSKVNIFWTSLFRDIGYVEDCATPS